MLSSTQYVENRVSDDDGLSKSKENVDNPETVENIVEKVIQPKYKESIKLALQALDKSYTKDEDEDIADVELGYKDFYNKRLLPYLIGTQEYEEDKYCGVYRDEDSEDEEINIPYKEGLPEELPEGTKKADDLTSSSSSSSSSSEVEDQPESENPTPVPPTTSSSQPSQAPPTTSQQSQVTPPQTSGTETKNMFAIEEEPASKMFDSSESVEKKS